MAADETRPVGGMAIVEGVMMRGPSRWVAAVRTADGSVRTTSGPVPSWSDAVKRIPVVRGVATLAESLSLGMRALAWSANQSADLRPASARRPSQPIRMGRTLALGLIIATGLFFVLPAVVARLVAGHGSMFTTVESIVRVAAFLAYLLAISQLRDVRRLFGYHGAEHMAVAAYEAGGPLTVGAARGFGRWHVRCGTTFLFVVVLVSALVGGLLGSLGWAALAVSRVVIVPLSAGIGYEILRAGAAGRWPARWLVKPGLLLQALTTRRPEDDQLEVALVALAGAVAESVAEEAGEPVLLPALAAPATA